MSIVSFRSAECHSPLVLVVVFDVVVVAAAVRVGSGGDRAAARLVMRTALTDQLLMLAESVLTSVVTTTGDTQDLPALLSLSPHGEVGVPGLVVFSIPTPPWRALSPSEPGISIFHWREVNSLDPDIVILTLTNINTVIVIPVTIHWHCDVATTSGTNLRQFSISL